MAPLQKPEGHLFHRMICQANHGSVQVSAVGSSLTLNSLIQSDIRSVPKIIDLGAFALWSMGGLSPEQVSMPASYNAKPF